ncbi:DUF2254 domain-containing protein [Rhodovulum sp. 12E13]|uniref:DUF2254 domain-containing protein n=1 Tax=Rhodovulum sp. 12E13 TaxID=2203891 RepID=UPI000E16400F|nr:DUF2254 domain-containing protein [Rhodovulum sp. 12E13]RDC68006.1 DUF2254 domain-containing protein [Rhodovulum sp. 12E13]
MISRYAWYLREFLKKVWVRVVGFAILALLAAVLARVLSPYLPPALALQTGSEAVSQLLGILTSSMLAVTTFSLSIAVSAFAAAAGSATPRATVLLQEDRTTQNVLATFLGAFLFGLVGLVALHADFYDASGKVVVFLFTVLVIGLVVVALIRWIGHLMQFGRMGDTLDRVERAACDALMRRLENPFLGGRPLRDAPPTEAAIIGAEDTGYIQHVDMQALQDCGESLETDVFLHRLPGSFVAPGTPLLSVKTSSLDDRQLADLRNGVTIGPSRNFDEDPRFGVIVLTEIASRALSPAVNDPGTAIDIIGRHVRLLARWRLRDDAEVRFDRVHVPPILVQDVIEDAFSPIARDGSALSEVQIRLQKALAALCGVAPELFAHACMAMSREAIARAEAAPLLAGEMAAIRSAAPDRIRADGPVP